MVGLLMTSIIADTEAEGIRRLDASSTMLEDYTQHSLSDIELTVHAISLE